MKEKCTLDNLVKRAAKRAELANEPMTIYVPSLDAEIDFIRLTEIEKKEFLTSYSSGNVDSIEINYQILYNCCPLMQDKALHELLEVTNPVDVVGKVFSMAEVGVIADMLLEIKDGDGIKLVKN